MHLGKIKVEIGNYPGREVGLGGGCLSQCVCACTEELLGPRKVLSAFVGSGVRIYDWDRIVENNFWGPGKFCRLLWGQGFEYVTGTGSWKISFGAPKSFVGFCGVKGSNM